MFRKPSILACFAAAAFAVLPAIANGQAQQPMMPSVGEANVKPALLDNIGIDQKLNAQVPGDLVFKDETGKDVKLGDYYGKKPIILTLVYFQCPQLCTVVLNDMVRTLNAMNAMSIGKQFDVLTVSFNPNETPELAASKKQQYLKAYGRQGAAEGWHFLTGSQESIKKLTDTVGFRYAWDPHYQQYIHASGLIVLTPDGRVSKYLYGIDYDPLDVRYDLDEAGASKIGGFAEQIILYCFHDDGTGKHALAVGRLIRTSGIVTILALGGFLTFMFYRDPNRSQKKNAAQATQSSATQSSAIQNSATPSSSAALIEKQT